jgi:hypothetical protein
MKIFESIHRLYRLAIRIEKKLFIHFPEIPFLCSNIHIFNHAFLLASSYVFCFDAYRLNRLPTNTTSHFFYLLAQKILAVSPNDISASISG